MQRRFLTIRRNAAHALHLMPYWLAVTRHTPLDSQVRKLPRRLFPRVWWTELHNITLVTDVRDWRRPSDGFSIAGDWDRLHVRPRPSIFEPATETTVKAMTHDTIRALFLEGRGIRETAQYRHMIDAVESEEPDLAYGCRSREEVDAYFRVLLGSFEDMRTHGYLTQEALGGGDPRDEIKLYLTRDGEWCHGNGGNHRIRIAELLGIEWVPFIFAGAHSEWVRSLSRDRDQPPRGAILNWLVEREERGTLRTQARAEGR